MLKNLKNRQDGFTIIEVMIVLVIAAVILLIVFLAVPALQRNSRNTQVKNEAAQLLSAAAEFTSNNNGTAPTASTSSAGGTTNADKILGLTKNKNITTLTVTTTAPSTAVVQATANLNTGYLVVGAKCNGSSPATTVAGTKRQIALLYNAETGTNGASTVACTESGL